VAPNQDKAPERRGTFDEPPGAFADRCLVGLRDGVFQVEDDRVGVALAGFGQLPLAVGRYEKKGAKTRGQIHKLELHYTVVGFGRYFEEFEAGQGFRHWPGRTISEADDTWFCLLTMNQNPLHIDAHYAAQTQHGQRLVSGPLVIAIVVGMSVADISGKAIANLEYEHIKHVAPVFHGDTIYAESRILETRESQTKPDRGIVSVETRGFNQRGETVLTLRRKVLIPKRPT
jgi:acyl dehydratase